MTLPRPPRRVLAHDVLSGRADMDAYPFRYMYLSAPPAIARSGRKVFDGEADVVLAAVELLETRGWELVNLDQLATIASCGGCPAEPRPRLTSCGHRP